MKYSDAKAAKGGGGTRPNRGTAATGNSSHKGTMGGGEVSGRAKGTMGSMTCNPKAKGVQGRGS